MRTATEGLRAIFTTHKISILAVLADRDQLRLAFQIQKFYISILAVLADRDLGGDPLVEPQPAISILAVLADRDLAIPAPAPAHEISILAVLADRDERFQRGKPSLCDFNPRGPCGPRHGFGAVMEVSV